MPNNQTVLHSQSFLDQKNYFTFLALVQSRIEYFSLRTYKISEQQANPEVLSVANSCHYDENFKNKHRLQTNACPLGAAPTNLAALGKSLYVKAPWWEQIFGANLRGCAGGWLWRKFIPALNWCFVRQHEHGCHPLCLSVCSVSSSYL